MVTNHKAEGIRQGPGVPYRKKENRDELSSRKCVCSHITIVTPNQTEPESTQVAEIKWQIPAWASGSNCVQSLPLWDNKHLLVILKILFGRLIEGQKDIEFFFFHSEMSIATKRKLKRMMIYRTLWALGSVIGVTNILQGCLLSVELLDLSLLCVF